jgi:hypothetical protein
MHIIRYLGGPRGLHTIASPSMLSQYLYVAFSNNIALLKSITLHYCSEVIMMCWARFASRKVGVLTETYTYNVPESDAPSCYLIVGWWYVLALRHKCSEYLQVQSRQRGPRTTSQLLEHQTACQLPVKGAHLVASFAVKHLRASKFQRLFSEVHSRFGKTAAETGLLSAKRSPQTLYESKIIFLLLLIQIISSRAFKM